MTITRKQSPGAKSVLVREEDAAEFLRLALKAPPNSQLRKTYQDAALLTVYFGRLNALKFGARDNRSGRPRGPTQQSKVLTEEIRRRLDEANGKLLTTVAKSYLAERGVDPTVLKDRADYIVRVYKSGK